MAWVTLQNVYDDSRYKVNKTSTDVADADLLRISNKVLREIYATLIGAGEDWYTEIAEFNLAATSTAANREYTLPTDSGSTPFGGGAIKVLKIECKADGTNWKIANPIPFTDIPEPYNETDLRNSFTNDNPYYSVFDNSFWLWTGNIASAVTSGGRIIYVKRPVELTAATATPDLPNEFLTVLSTGITKDLYERFGAVDRWQIANSQFEQQLARLNENQMDRGTPENPRFMGADISYK